MKAYLTSGLIAIGLFAQQVSAAEHTVVQENKAFDHEELVIKRGDSVVFINNDPFFHNVYSMSLKKSFDLGSFPKGESRKVTFDKKGEVKVECAMHPNMTLTIFVE